MTHDQEPARRLARREGDAAAAAPSGPTDLVRVLLARGPCTDPRPRRDRAGAAADTQHATAYWSSMPEQAPDVPAIVGGIIADVRERGDEAVREYSARFDSWSPDSFELDHDARDRIIAGVPQQVTDDIRFVQEQVRSFAQIQRDSMLDVEVETMPGVRLGHRHVPIERSGAYIPGGRYPLTASAHMTIVTAKVAGVDEVVACTPPIRGEIPAATIAAMHLAGADRIFLLGGVQAVAAMALGTATIPRVNLIAGPGNAFVAEAKRQLFGEVGIDLFAGPTEILVIADDSADPFTVAVDLLSQAEHGPDSPAVLVTTSAALAAEVEGHIAALLPGCRPPTTPARPGAATAASSWSTPWMRPGRSPTTSRSSMSRCTPVSRASRWSGCATTAPCSSATSPASPTATR